MRRFTKKYSIWLLIFFFGALYSFYSVLRHLRFESFSFDLGIYDQMIWLASRGKPLFSSILESHLFGDHFTPTLLLLAPLYWLWNNVLALLIFQAFFCTFGAFPIYLLSLKKTKDFKLSLLISFCYLAFFGLQNALAFDFHPLVLATTLLAWLFWLYEEKKERLFWLVLILFWGLQENFFLLGAAFGIFLLLRYRDLRRGILITSASLTLFLLTIFVIIPYFGQAPFTYLPTHLKNLGLGGAIKMFFYPWSKVQVIIVSFLGFGFLPFLSPAFFILLFEEFFQRFVGTPISTRWSLGFQYNVILAPILAFGAIEAIGKKFQKRKKLAMILLLGGWLLVQGLTSPSLNDLFDRNFYYLGKAKEVREILALIPPRASVSATNNLGPHLTHRTQVLLLANCYDDPQVWKIDMKRCFKLKPDFLVADLDPKGDVKNFYPDYDRDSLARYFAHLEKSGEYKVVAQKDWVVLLGRTK